MSHVFVLHKPGLELLVLTANTPFVISPLANGRTEIRIHHGGDHEVYETPAEIASLLDARTLGDDVWPKCECGVDVQRYRHGEKCSHFEEVPF